MNEAKKHNSRTNINAEPIKLLSERTFDFAVGVLSSLTSSTHATTAAA